MRAMAAEDLPSKLPLRMLCHAIRTTVLVGRRWQECQCGALPLLIAAFLLQLMGGRSVTMALRLEMGPPTRTLT